VHTGNLSNLKLLNGDGFRLNIPHGFSVTMEVFGWTYQLAFDFAMVHKLGSWCD
jgi:hypothetical protein